MKLDLLRQHPSPREIAQLAPRSAHVLGALSAALLVFVSLGGASLADEGWHKGLHLTLGLVALVLLAWNVVYLRRSGLAEVAPLRRGVVATRAAGGAALGIAAWLFFAWSLPVGFGVVAVMTGVAAMQGWIRAETLQGLANGIKRNQ